MYATFQLRGSTDNIASLFASTKVQNMVYADAMVEDILSIGFYPLLGDEAGVCGHGTAVPSLSGNERGAAGEL